MEKRLMRSVICIATLAFSAISFAPAANADILLQTDYFYTSCCGGPQHDLDVVRSLAQGFGFYAPVFVDSIVFPVVGSGSFDLWITDSIGPGTVAQDVLFQTSVAFPETVTTDTVPIGIDLNAGNYYLILSSQSFGDVFTDAINDPPTAYGYTTFTATESYYDSSAFAPGIPFQSLDFPGGGLYFTMTGTSQTTPESLPSSLSYSRFGGI